MLTTPTGLEPAVTRTERGLVLAGTRLTLYQIIDYLEAGWPHEEIRALHGLTERQFAVLLEYIEDHREAAMAEYAAVVRANEEDRRYWEERNRERFARIAAAGPPPGREEAWAKLQTRKRELANERSADGR